MQPIGSRRLAPVRETGSSTLIRFALLAAAVCVLASPALGANGWLGVSVQNVTPELKEAMDLAAQSGALVSDVVPDSPADRAGIRARDVIIKIDDRPVEKADDVVDYVSDKDPGADVRVTIVQGGGDEREVQLTLGERPASQAPNRRERRMPGMRNIPGMNDDEVSSLLSRFGLGPQLGVRVQPLDKYLAPYFQTESGSGLLVLGVEPNSPAEKAGIQPGDVLRQLNGEPISDVQALQSQVRAMHPGDDFKIEALRHGKQMDLRGRIEKGWRSPSEMGSTRLRQLGPRMQERSSVWERRQADRLEREMRNLQRKVQELEHRIDRMRER